MDQGVGIVVWYRCVDAQFGHVQVLGWRGEGEGYQVEGVWKDAVWKALDCVGRAHRREAQGGVGLDR